MLQAHPQVRATDEPTNSDHNRCAFAEADQRDGRGSARGGMFMHSGAAQRWQAADTFGVRPSPSATCMDGFARWWRAHRSIEAERPVHLSAFEARVAALLARADIGVVVTDARGKLLLTNAALDRFVGFEAGGLAGMLLRAISHPEDAAVDEVLFQELRAGKRDSYCMEKRYVRADGSLVWGRLTMASLLADDGETLHSIGL